MALNYADSTLNLTPESLNAYLDTVHDFNYDGGVEWDQAIRDVSEGMSANKSLKLNTTCPLSSCSPSTSTSDLHNILSKGDPVIVGIHLNGGVPQHYVLVTGELPFPGNQFTINDPGHKNDYLYNGAQYSATILRNADLQIVGYVADPPMDISGLDLNTNDAVEMLLIDSSGRKLGFDPNIGNVLYQIPNGVHFINSLQNDITLDLATAMSYSINIFQPLEQTYHLVLRGLHPGPFTLTARGFSTDGSQQTPVVLQGEIATGASVTYEISFASSPGSIITLRPLDTTPPVIVPQITGTLGNNGWYRSNVTVSWSVKDPESGITSTAGCSTTTLVSDTSGVTLRCSAINGVGLSATVPLTIKIDKTAPIAMATPVPAPNADGWNSAKVTVSFTGTDNLSGIDFCSASITFTNAGAGQIATGTCTDKAGNSSAAATVTVNIDKNPPVISGMPVPGCTLWPPNHKLVTVGTVTASDALSGLAPGSLAVTGTSNEPGSPGDPQIVITPNGSGGYVVQLQADRLGTGTAESIRLTPQPRIWPETLLWRRPPARYHTIRGTKATCGIALTNHDVFAVLRDINKAAPRILRQQIQ